MRRISLAGTMLITAALLLVPGTVAAQEPTPGTVTRLCITVLGAPAADWSLSELVAALDEGTVMFTTVTAPALCAAAEPAASPTAGGVEIWGGFTLRDSDAKWKKGQACRGRGGYSDIQPATQVRVSDAAGTLLAVGSLGRGTASSRTECEFIFVIEDVPEVPIYSIEASHRGAIIYTLDELRERDFIVTLGLGG